MTMWRPSRAEMMFSAKCFIAAMLAAYVALWAGLPRPFWSVMTTYIVAAPMAGAVRSKALFRLGGTFLGSMATLFMVPALSSAPLLLTLALASWVGLCLFISLQDRTPRSYLFMLAGYTAALIGFPAVDTPNQLFDNAISRVEEIGIGIVCATMVHSLVFPVSMAPSLVGLLDRAMGDARQWVQALLHRLPGKGTSGTTEVKTDRARLAMDITQLRLLSTHIPFDTGNVAWTAGAIDAMQEALIAVTPALSAVEDRLDALMEPEGHLPADVQTVLHEVGEWMAAVAAKRTGVSDAQPLLSKLAGYPSTDEEPDPAALWGRALRTSLAERLCDLVRAWSACESLRRDVDLGLEGRPIPSHNAKLNHRALHADKGMAALSALSVVFAVCICCFFWIETGWSYGYVAAMMAAVFCSLFSAMDDPVPAIQGFLKATLESVPISVFYVLVLLPMVRDYGMLVLICAPTFLILGCFVARPATMGRALAMTLGVASTLALHDTGTDDFPGFFMSTLGQVLGSIVAAVVVKTVRTMAVDRVARRIRQANFRELEQLAAGSGPNTEDAERVARMLDRIGLLAPRIAAQAPDYRDQVAREAVSEMRLGADLQALQRVRDGLHGADVASLFTQLAQLFQSRAEGDETPGRTTLLRRLDHVLEATLRGNSHLNGEDSRAAVTALVGLRRNLFPQAPLLGQRPEESMGVTA